MKTIDKTEILKLYIDGIKIKEIAARMDCCEKTIYNSIKGINLRKPDAFKLCNINTNLSSSHLEVIDGLLLGDGSLIKGKRSKTPHLSYVSAKKEIINHIKSIIPIVSTIHKVPARQRVFKDKIGNCKEAYVLESRVDLSLNDLFEKWYRPRKMEDKGNKRYHYIKILPHDLSLTPTSIKYWFYGDGSTTYQKRNAVKTIYVKITFFTNGFSFSDCELLKIKLNESIGVDFNVENKDGNPILVCSKKDYIHKFFDCIKECDLNCYKYKWKTPKQGANNANSA